MLAADQSNGILISWLINWLRRTNHMDWWIDRFWQWLDLPLARHGGSRPVRFSTICPIPFYTDFRMHFGTEMASDLEPCWSFARHFGINFSTVEFVWIFIEFRWIFGTLKPWKIQFLLDTLVKNREITHSDFTLILYQHLITFWHGFWNPFPWFSILFRRWFSDAFLDVFF